MNNSSGYTDGYNAGKIMQLEKSEGGNPDGRQWLSLAATQGKEYFNEFKHGFTTALREEN